MTTHAPNENAPGQGSAYQNQAGGPAPSTQKVVDCGTENITAVCRELREAGVELRAADGRTQLETLRRALEYRGDRGLNTYEGTAAGYLRFATRIFNLKEQWNIYTLREDVIGPDGLLHKGVARYVLLGRRHDLKKAAASPTEPGGGA
ncbi:hypothetical protein GCM10027317_42050 [Massilia agri]